MAASTRRSPSALALDTYDPFGAESSSFLPPMGLFSPVAAAPSPSRPTPNFCATIFEEEDAEDSSAAEDMRSSASSSTTITPDNNTDFQRRQSASSAFAIHPRILRSDSCSDDDSDIPPVLRFPVPPSTIPTTTRSPPKHLPALKPVSIPPPPAQLKSCFEDDDDDDEQVVVAPSPVASRRSSPTGLTTLMASRPAPPPPSKPFALLKKATSALKSSSPPRSASKLATGEKPLPRVPHAQRPRITPAPYDGQQPISVSPTPSLSSSSSSSDCSSATLPYIPVGSIIPAPAIVQDLDDYLETLEMYFPAELWEDHPHELRRKPNSAAVKSRSSSSSSSSSSSAGAGAHRKRPSNSSSSSSSSCSRSSSDENLQHRRKSSFDDAVVDVQRLLKNSASSGNMKLASYTSTLSTTVRISSPLSPPAEIRSHSRSGSDSPTSTAYSSSSSSSSSPSNSSTITPGSRTPSPTFAKHTTPLSPPKSILKPSKSSPLLRDRSTSVSSTISVVSPPPPVSRSSSRSSAYNSVPMSPTRGRAPVPMHQLLSR